MSRAVELIRVADLSQTVPYAYAAAAPAGARLVFFAGACPLDDDGRTVAVGDLTGQVAACVQNLRLALTAAGATVQDILFVRVIVATTSRHDLATAWSAVREAFGEHDAPGTLMATTVLGWQDQLVELEVVAALIE